MGMISVLPAWAGRVDARWPGHDVGQTSWKSEAICNQGRLSAGTTYSWFSPIRRLLAAGSWYSTGGGLLADQRQRTQKSRSGNAKGIHKIPVWFLFHVAFALLIIGLFVGPVTGDQQPSARILSRAGGKNFNLEMVFFAERSISTSQLRGIFHPLHSSNPSLSVK